jgi:hypothetical protein
MFSLKAFLCLGLFLLLTSCGGAPASPTAIAPVPTAVSPTVALSTAGPATAVPPTGLPPTPEPTPAPLVEVDVDPARYIDNRSDAVAVLQSMYNAVNRNEYVRAYSYWEPDAAATYLPTYPQFEQGYSNTVAVALSVGPVTGGAAAGNLYYAVPTVLRATHGDGTVWTFAGCYVLHLGQPANYGAPPFPSMAIQSANIQPAADSTELAMMAVHACQELGAEESPLPPASPPPAGDVSVAYYIDDRSGAAEVMQSFYNAINRKEYVRAYSYWEESAAATFLPPYSQFEQGYATTVSVRLTTGQVTSDAGAGQLYYRVPAALVALQSDGTTQTFVGCYTLHLGQPSFQGAPPFQPLGIAGADIRQVANDADLETELGTACP